MQEDFFKFLGNAAIKFWAKLKNVAIYVWKPYHTGYPFKIIIFWGQAKISLRMIESRWGTVSVLILQHAFDTNFMIIDEFKIILIDMIWKLRKPNTHNTYENMIHNFGSLSCVQLLYIVLSGTANKKSCNFCLMLVIKDLNEI